MRLSALPPYPVPSCFTNNYVPNQPKPSFRNRIFRRVACNSGRSESTQVTGASYKLGVFDDVFLNVFRAKMVKVRILVSLFPSWLLELYKKLIAPLGGGQVAAVMVARVTAITCQWLMGPCTINSVDLDNGSSWQSGVYVEKCKYLEESKC
uniref:Beta-carotene isomerase D27-like C-terminal domain-containing protein n=1 Tax=Kalanchoe fedtschenkoi TaxID=63787 RepID=A0A7N0TUX7_KALFE